MKKRGRPPKNGVMEPGIFLRAVQVICAYSKARNEGQKHSIAVREAVEFVRKVNPAMAISETGVKRVLAEFQPHESQVALMAEYLILEGEEAARRRSLIAQIPESAGTNRATEPTAQNLRKPLKSFRFGFGRRPNYTRHNAKTSNF